MQPIFTALFKNNPSQRIFRFLDESAAPGEDMRILTSLPPLPFLSA